MTKPCIILSARSPTSRIATFVQTGKSRAAARQLKPRDRTIAMSTALTIVSDSATLPAALGPDLAAAIDLAKAEKAASTRKAYGTDFRIFKDWCEARGVAALPAAPETVAAYLAAHAASSKASTLGRRVAAIRYAHKLAGRRLRTEAEGCKATLRGIRRTYGGGRVRQAPAGGGKRPGLCAQGPGQ